MRIAKLILGCMSRSKLAKSEGGETCGRGRLGRRGRGRGLGRRGIA